MMPLLQPADCSVLLVDPRARHLSRLDAARQADPAARCLNSPRKRHLPAPFRSTRPSPGAFPELHDWAPPLRPLPPAHVHALGTEGSSWSSSGLLAVLAAQNRGSLILAGFWLETTVTFLALPALAAGLEVFVLIRMPAQPGQNGRPPGGRSASASWRSSHHDAPADCRVGGSQHGSRGTRGFLSSAPSRLEPAATPFCSAAALTSTVTRHAPQIRNAAPRLGYAVSTTNAKPSRKSEVASDHLWEEVQTADVS